MWGLPIGRPATQESESAAMTYRPLVALATLALLAGCATDQAPPPSRPGSAAARPAGPQGPEFKAADFAWATVAGKGRIDGQLVFKAGATVYSCAEAGVLLTPQTDWTRARMVTLYQSASHAVQPAAEVRARTVRSNDYSAYVRRATCDPTGRFTFTNLPDGGFFAITVAKPATPGAGQDMAIMRYVKVSGGKVVEVKL
jgi:hypothetical protein